MCKHKQLLIILLVSFIPTTIAFPETNHIDQQLRIVLVVAPQDFTDQEYFDPKAVFEKDGASIITSSTTLGVAISHNRAEVRIDLPTTKLKVDQFDAIVIVGGMGTITYLLKDEALRNILVSSIHKGKVVAAICLAPVVLAQSGILRNQRATCYPDKSIITTLKINGADYSDSSVVVSGNIVTANGPQSAREFVLQILKILNHQDVNKE